MVSYANFIFVSRHEVFFEGVCKDLVAQLHMPTLSDPEIESLLFVQEAQTDPVFPIDVPFLQLCHHLTRSVDLGEKGTLLGDDCCVVCKHKHDESAQPSHVFLVGVIFHFPLIIYVSQKVAIFKIVVQILRVSIVLRGHQSALRKRAPRIAFEDTAPGLTQPIISSAVLKLTDTVMLTSKGNKMLHSWIVAALNVSSKELAALREAKSIDGRSFGEYRV